MSIVRVPVTIAVRKYLLKEYSNFVDRENGRAVIQLHRKYFLGNFLASLMTDDLEHYKVYDRPEEFVTFKLSRGFERSYMIQENINKLSYHLDHLFKNEFCKFIGYYHAFGLSIAEAIDNFYDHYGLCEDDYSKDNMRRYYNRYGAEGSEWSQEKISKKFNGSRPEKLNKTVRKRHIPSTFQRMQSEFAILQDLDLQRCTFLRIRKQVNEHLAKKRS